MCAQVRNAPRALPPDGNTLLEAPFGVPAGDTPEAVRPEIYKELVNKLAWALGSTYRLNYSNAQMPARQYANRLVGKIIADHGFPRDPSKK